MIAILCTFFIFCILYHSLQRTHKTFQNSPTTAIKIKATIRLLLTLFFEGISLFLIYDTLYYYLYSDLWIEGGPSLFVITFMLSLVLFFNSCFFFPKAYHWLVHNNLPFVRSYRIKSRKSLMWILVILFILLNGAPIAFITFIRLYDITQFLYWPLDYYQGPYMHTIEF